MLYRPVGSNHRPFFLDNISVGAIVKEAGKNKKSEL
jgi:hypothetical protein